jgi:hypothetical protein
MSNEPVGNQQANVPGLDSPIRAIREIQAERVLGDPALKPPEPAKMLLCQILLQKPDDILEIASPLPKKALLGVLGQAYLALKAEIEPLIQVAGPVVPKGLIRP